MKQISNKEYEKYQQYQIDKLHGRILTPDGLRVICAGLDNDPEKIGIHMQEETSPFAVATYNLFFGCLFIALVRHPWTTVDAPFNASLLLYGLLFGLIATALAYSIYFSGLSKITETGKVPVVASIELVVATIIGVFAFSESMTIIKIVGIVLVLLSILLFSWKTTPD